MLTGRHRQHGHRVRCATIWFVSIDDAVARLAPCGRLVEPNLPGLSQHANRSIAKRVTEPRVDTELEDQAYRFLCGVAVSRDKRG